MTLGAELNEMGAFEGGGGEEDTVVGDDADFVAVDVREACYECRAVVSLELREDTTVNNPRNDFVDW